MRSTDPRDHQTYREMLHEQAAEYLSQEWKREILFRFTGDRPFGEVALEALRARAGSEIHPPGNIPFSLALPPQPFKEIERAAELMTYPANPEDQWSHSVAFGQWYRHEQGSSLVTAEYIAGLWISSFKVDATEVTKGNPILSEPLIYRCCELMEIDPIWNGRIFRSASDLITRDRSEVTAAFREKFTAADQLLLDSFFVANYWLSKFPALILDSAKFTVEADKAFRLLGDHFRCNREPVDLTETVLRSAAKLLGSYSEYDWSTHKRSGFYNEHFKEWYQQRTGKTL